MVKVTGLEVVMVEEVLEGVELVVVVVLLLLLVVLELEEEVVVVLLEVVVGVEEVAVGITVEGKEKVKVGKVLAESVRNKWQYGSWNQ